MKIVINKIYGGFELSDEAMMEYAKRKGIVLYPEVDGKYRTTYWTVPESERVKELPEPWMENSKESRLAYNSTIASQILRDGNIPRDDVDLVAVVEELGDRANGLCSCLGIVDIPDGVNWEIEEYDGNEWVSEKHRRWD